MKTALLISTLATIFLATLADAQDMAQGVVVASGVRYRFSSVNTLLILRPDSSDSDKPARVLSQSERMARCDELVAAALKERGLPGPGNPGLVRDRVEGLPHESSWVIYSQRHQGYRVLGAGGRLELDSHGRIQFAGLSYETEKLRHFQPLDSAAIEKRAAAAVPHSRVGGPFSQELMIDPLEGAPAELRSYFTYRIRNHDQIEGWQVIVNAETGKVIDSSSTVRQIDSQAHPRLGS